MSSSSSPVLVVELQRHWLRLLPASMLLLSALVIPWLAGFSLLYMLLMSMIGIVLAAWAMRVQLIQRLFRLSWQQDQTWLIQASNADVRRARLLGRSWWSPWVICLKFIDDAGQRLEVLLWRVEMPGPLWQQLRLRLRLEGHTATMAMLEHG